MINSKIEISGTQIIKTLLISGGIFALMIMGSDVLLPLMVAVIIAVLLDKPTKKLTKWGIPNRCDRNFGESHGGGILYPDSLHHRG